MEKTQKIFDISGKPVGYVDPSEVDKTGFSLNIFGEKTSELSDALNENFIRLAQNFYGSTQPKSPFCGQRWHNSDDGIMYQWDSKNWIQFSRVDYAHDSFMFVRHNTELVTEFVLDEFVFNFTLTNLLIFDQNMNAIKFIIDQFDSRKVILRDKGSHSLYMVVFHPKDIISNPNINKKVDIIATSGQTQFDVKTIIGDIALNTLSLTINDVLVKNNEFYIHNGIVNLNGMVYRVRNGDKVTIWQHGGSIGNYYGKLKLHMSGVSDILRIPKFFKHIETIEFHDTHHRTSISPMDTTTTEKYIEFEFLGSRNLAVEARICLI